MRSRPAACTANVGRAALPHSGGKCPRGLPAGSGYATEAASSGVYCDCWVSNAAAVRREMEAGTARWARGANARDNHKRVGKSSLRSGLPLSLKVFSRARFASETAQFAKGKRALSFLISLPLWCAPQLQIVLWG